MTKDLFKKWWFWLIVISIVLIVISFLPLWQNCGRLACYKVNFWNSRYFVIID